MAALAACSPGDVDDEAKGGTLTVYVSAPLSGRSGEEGRAIVNGAKLALADAGGEAGGLDVEAVYMDDTSGRGGGARWDPVVTADNARRAAQDSTAIAYIGELESGATRTSLPITNQAFMLQVSAGSTAVDLAQRSPASDDVPDLYQPTGTRTFGRVIPDDEKQAGAAAVWAKKLGADDIELLRGGSDFGETIAAEFEEEVSALGIAVDRRRLERNFGCPPESATYVAADADEASGYVIPAHAVPSGGSAGGPARASGSAASAASQPSAASAASDRPPAAALPPMIANDSFLFGDVFQREVMTQCADNARITSSTQDPEQLPPAGQRFARAYEREFGEPPNRYAAYGYEAMAVVLDSVERAADPRDRSAVIDAFFATADRSSVLGTYSIDEVGNTTLDAISGYRIESGRPSFDIPLRAP